MEKERNILKPKTWNKYDWISLIIMIIIFISITIFVNMPKNGCEIARPGYKCESAWNVMKENCIYWGNWSCDSSKDISLPQIEWYILNLCQIHNRYHENKLDCNNLKAACNIVTEKNIC
ncbi:MAG: hypothetical protein QXF15_02275 [Candidatus Aenigmatarchaeota archaeon]|nr:hypothetical protein [Candidatus Aenigmarchaeota archaeon]